MSYFSPPPRPEGAEQSIPLSASLKSPSTSQRFPRNLTWAGSQSYPHQAPTGQLHGEGFQSGSNEKRQPAASPTSSLKYNLDDFEVDLQECVMAPSQTLRTRGRVGSSHECERLKKLYRVIRSDLEELSERRHMDMVQQIQSAMAKQEELFRGKLCKHEELLSGSMSRQEQLLRHLLGEHTSLVLSGEAVGKLSETKLSTEPKDLNPKDVSIATCDEKVQLQKPAIMSAVHEAPVEVAKKVADINSAPEYLDAEPEPHSPCSNNPARDSCRDSLPNLSRSMAEVIKLDIASKRKAIMLSKVSVSSRSIGTEECSSMHDKIVNALRSDRFEHISCLITMLNFIFYGIEVHVLARQHKPGKHLSLSVIMVLFTIYFGCELSGRLYAYRKAFFFGEDQWWNMVDALVVLASIFEIVMDQFGSDRSFLRFAQIARMLRIFRIIRAFRFLQDLKTLVHSILSTMQQLVWTIALIFLLLYMFAIMFTEAATSSGLRLLETTEDGTWPCNADENDAQCSLQTKYGDLLVSMLTLYMSITGGMDWSEAFEPLTQSDVGPMFASMFIVFLTFTTLAVMNVVTAIFCQSAIDGAANQRDVQMQKFEEQQEMYSKQLREVFQELDENASGDLTMDEFEIGIVKSKVQTFFESMELRIQEARVLFQLLQSEEGKSIEIDAFVDGCLQLRGSARNFDVALLRYECRYLSNKVTELLRKSEEQWVLNTPQASFNSSAKAASPSGNEHQAMDWREYVK